MLDIKLIRENPDKVKTGIEKKGFDPQLVDQLLLVDEKRRTFQQQAEKLRAERKQLGPDNLDRAREVKQQLEVIEKDLREADENFQAYLRKLPNLPFDEVPVGKDDSENVVIRQWGTPRQFDFPVKDHVELGEALGIIDTDAASKISGARFAYLKGRLALVEFALIQYTMSIVTDSEKLKAIADEAGLKDINLKPFTPVLPPVFIRPEVMERMARLEPADDRYYIQSDDLYLIGSAEHTLGPLHMDQMLTEDELPIRYAGFSTSFRREAGSYGRDTKGILRLHQFDKIELESFTLPEESVKEQDLIVAIQEYLVRSLDLPYQVIAICTGDMGDPDARQIDIETWMPGQNKYRETHTSDLMTDYQARRLNTRVKRSTGEAEYVHMNDATAFAIGRILIAILENGQQADGSVILPNVLVPYLGFNEIK